jgi:hypothetical protein
MLRLYLTSIDRLGEAVYKVWERLLHSCIRPVSTAGKSNQAQYCGVHGSDPTEMAKSINPYLGNWTVFDPLRWGEMGPKRPMTY